MRETTHVRANKGKYKLLSLATCVECRQPMYESETPKYRVRVSYAGLNGAPAFYYSHATCPANGT